MADAGAGRRRRRGAAERLAIGLFLAGLALLLILDPPTGAGAAKPLVKATNKTMELHFNKEKV